MCWKPPGSKALLAHQDAAYETFIVPMNMTTCWIALDDTHADTGTIYYARGSHLWGRMPMGGQFHAPDDWTGHARQVAPPELYDQVEWVPIEVPAGAAPRDDHERRVAAVLGDVLAHPLHRELHVDEVVGERRAWAEPVVRGHAHPAVGREVVHERPGLLLLAADEPPSEATATVIRTAGENRFAIQFDPGEKAIRRRLGVFTVEHNRRLLHNEPADEQVEPEPEF